MKMYAKRVEGEWGMGARAGFAALVMAIGLGFAAAPALAQGAAKPAKPAAPAAAGDKKPDAAAADDKNKTFWLKLCQKVTLTEPKKDAKDAKEAKDGATTKEVNICSTQHEQIYGPNGEAFMIAIGQADGQDKQVLQVIMPLGVVLPVGALMQFDEGEKITIPYVFCGPHGCTAETEATKDVIDKIKKAKRLAVGTPDMTRRIIGFAAPTTGFEQALGGPAADTKEISEARKRVVMTIREKMIAAQKKAQEDAGAAGGAPAGGAKAPAPADKKGK